MTPSEALRHIQPALTDDLHRAVVLRGVIVIAQKGLGIAPDGKAEDAPNVLPFPTR